MISVEEATDRLLALVGPVEIEDVSLRAAAGRILAHPVTARHDQPPFAASSMDGYAIGTEAANIGDAFRVIGESAAGHPFKGKITARSAVRIFTGAMVPPGTVRVLIQEDVARVGDRIVVAAEPGGSVNVRAAGGDFRAGMEFDPKRSLGSRDVAMLAAMGHDMLPVRSRPNVAILMTGDELRPPGEPLGPGEITASNGYGLAAMFDAAGAETHLLPIARDTSESLRMALELATGADLIVTIGGASVGDHDLIAGAASHAGLDLAFHKVAMRPGKPLLAGRLHDAAFVGLPGNPVSAMVCGVIFILPMLRAMLTLPPQVPTRRVPLATSLASNGPRQHYMRGRMTHGLCTPFEKQDSSLLHILQEADVLAIRPPNDSPHRKGDEIEVVPLPR
ncbi:Molybdopterin molybdenumtransferase [Jannaschia seosinensis]|uniref:Molybdopterin molybdenumtransferase n=1 Tax=Jannaschia seosinensis TaxID=313367 RepID=A0A0M7B5Y9_9RHOB|nr:molybdopterin molybdotransferase MoeA [Jannaschia seosinensis]CUH10679.1 Molybdopterin molybdenumtransferase [Jannaschia seosinensis]